MATFPAFSPVETSVAEQIITRLAGMGTWNCPCGMTAVGVLTRQRRGCWRGGLERIDPWGADEIRRGLRGLRRAGRGGCPAAASVEAAAAAKMISVRRMGVSRLV